MHTNTHPTVKNYFKATRWQNWKQPLCKMTWRRLVKLKCRPYEQESRPRETPNKPDTGIKMLTAVCETINGKLPN